MRHPAEQDISICSYMTLPGLRPELNRISFKKYSDSDKIIRIVVEFTGITVDQMIGNGKNAHVSDSRFIMWRMLRRFTKLTLMDIGQMFRRDHTSIMYGVQRCEDLISTEPSFRDKIRFIESQL